MMFGLRTSALLFLFATCTSVSWFPVPVYLGSVCRADPSTDQLFMSNSRNGSECDGKAQWQGSHAPVQGVWSV